ncbi:RNA polymerase factor sigma-54 [Acidovorax sp.]|uniref:RNA polymerase factor sigma-54 n=1 Tax=Acidovorax sp. TaxID=1872122 RepID=UPI00391F354E
MKPGLSLRVSQHLALTPQLQQSIRLLQLSTLELGQEVEQMLDENPFLERNADEAPREEFGVETADAPAQSDDYSSDEAVYSNAPGSNTSSESVADTSPGDAELGSSASDEPDWSGDGTVDVSPNDAEWGGDAPARTRNDAEGDEADATELARSHESLTAFLHRQALSLRLSEVDSAALRFLIESLNDDGYLEEPLEELAIALAGPDDLEQIEELVHRFTVALRLLQNLEPVGVGARNLGECLTLQLAALAADEDSDADPDTVQTALRVCQQPLEMLARRDIRRLTQLCGDGEERTRAAMALIARLEPRPGRKFVDVERNIIVPDVIVRKAGRANGRDGQHNFIVALNPDVMPRLRVHDIYAGALRGHKGGEGHQAMQQRLQEARWFIKNIQQRFDTILRVSRAIVERQKSFFTHGELAMRPLVLRDIADELGLHESTISRVTTAKYMATPIGTYELKYFFGSGLGTETGGNASSTAVRALIKQFVAAESPAKPLSDSQIAEMLKEQGIECARRTVAKYREALKIAPANLRKAL